MLRSALIGLVALGVMAGGVVAGQDGLRQAYKDFWEKFDREKYAKITPSSCPA